MFLLCYSDSSSSSSDESPARSVQSAAVPAPSALPLSSLDKDEPRKSFGIKVQNLPVRSTGWFYPAIIVFTVYLLKCLNIFETTI